MNASRLRRDLLCTLSQGVVVAPKGAKVFGSYRSQLLKKNEDILLKRASAATPKRLRRRDYLKLWDDPRCVSKAVMVSYLGLTEKPDLQ